MNGWCIIPSNETCSFYLRNFCCLCKSISRIWSKRNLSTWTWWAISDIEWFFPVYKVLPGETLKSTAPVRMVNFGPIMVKSSGFPTRSRLRATGTVIQGSPCEDVLVSWANISTILTGVCAESCDPSPRESHSLYRS